MVRRVARKLVRAIRRFNRSWIDALDPDYRPGTVSVEAPPRPAPSPAEPTAAPSPAEPAAAAPSPGAEAPAPQAAGRTAAVEVWAEPTPNPDAMKFSASVPVAPRGARSFDGPDAAGDDPLGRAVFGVGGVRSMFAVNDFVTVTREPDAAWSELVPRLEAAIAGVLAG